MNTIKSKLNTTTLLWLALALVLLGSLTHLAATFASIDGNHALAWIQAIAIDAGLFALAYSLRQKKMQGRSQKWTMAGLALFTLISVYANLYYGLQATGALPSLLALLVQIKPIVLAATPPILVLYLAELIAGDKSYDEQEIKTTLQEMQNEKLQLEDEKLQLEQEKMQAEKEIAKLKAEKDKLSFGPNEKQKGDDDNSNGDSLDKANKVRVNNVSERREKVLQFLKEGMTQNEIADRLDVHPSTIARDKQALNGKVKSIAV